MRAGPYGALLLCSAIGCRPSTPTTVPAEPPTAAEVAAAVREYQRDVSPGPRTSDVALFVLPAVAPVREAEPEPCPGPTTTPTSIRTIITDPGYGQVYANDELGALLHRVDQEWVPVALPEEVPEIAQLLGFKAAASPLELVVLIHDGIQSELWTLVLAQDHVEQAWPTVLEPPEFSSTTAFLQTHHTPRCLTDNRRCLAVTEVDRRTYIDIEPKRWATPRQPLLQLGPGTKVLDVSWADDTGETIYVAASGVLCPEPSTP